MKIRSLILFAAALLLLAGIPLRAAQAPKLDTLLAEYHKARADVLGKLNEAYALQADALASQYVKAPNLEAAERARQFARHLRDPDEKNNLAGLNGGDPGADPLAVLQADYAQARAANLANVYGFYTTTAANLRRELLRTKDQAGADVLTTFLAKIKPAAATVTTQPTPDKSHNLSSK